MKLIVDRETVEQYERDGVVRIRNVLTLEEVDEVRRELKRYEQEVLPLLSEEFYMYEADGHTLRNMIWMNLWDPYFAELSERLKPLAASMVEWEPMGMSVETFNKVAGRGDNVPIHQDIAFLTLDPPHLLTIWTAIDEATEANGAVRFVRGSHKLGLQAHAPADRPGVYQLAEPPDLSQVEEFVAELSPGDVFIHHGHVFHRSLPNPTNKPRCGLLMVYRCATAYFGGPEGKMHEELGPARDGF